MKERILKLCKRLKKFSLDEICIIADDISTTEIKNTLNNLILEKYIVLNNGYYSYLKKHTIIKNNFLKFYQKKQIEILCKCFCLEIPAIKSSIIVEVCEKTSIEFYTYFRKIIYQEQYKRLLCLYNKYPQQARYRQFFDKIAYFYMYNNTLFVSDYLLGTNEDKLFSKDEVLEFKNIYSYLDRIEKHNSNQKYLYYRLAEGIWRRNKNFIELYNYLIKMLFS